MISPSLPFARKKKTFETAPYKVESAHPSKNDADEEKKTLGAGGVVGVKGGGVSSVVPAPITEPVLPARTRLQEVAAEVAVYYSQIEGQVGL